MFLCFAIDIRKEVMMKKIISTILVVLFLGNVSCHAITTKEKEEEVVWNIISSYSPNDKITAALVSIMKGESGYKSNAVHGWYWLSPDYCEVTTDKIDSGMQDGSTRNPFVYNRLGYAYGLLQWSSFIEREKLYDYACTYGTSIGDAEMQASFIFWDLETNFSDLYDRILIEEDMNQIVHELSIYYMGTVHYDIVWMRMDVAKELIDRYS